MKKTLIMAFLLMFGLVAHTQAVGSNSNQGNKAGQETEIQTVQGNQAGKVVQTTEQNKVMNQGETTQVQTQAQVQTQTQTQAQAQTQTQAQVQDEVKTKEKNTENKKKFNAESHRSTVATFVQSLLGVADREGGIGQEVRVIAQQQNEIKNRASDLINAVENRNKIKEFFIGTSYKNLGELRSQVVQSRNQIEQLKQLAERAENEGAKIELQNQIQLLEQEQINTNNFIAQNENQFSLFGWAVKLFRQ